jgi:predicted hotdog family 3-hydroxylacyl-ACP dehydratase
MTSPPYPPIADLVPHQPPMLALDRLVDWGPGRAECTAEVRSDSPLVRDGTVGGVVGIEYLAQAVAACLGYEALQGGDGVRVGMIIACRQMDILQPELKVGTQLTLSVRRIRGNETLSHFEGEMHADGALACTAMLTLYHAEAPPELSR